MRGNGAWKKEEEKKGSGRRKGRRRAERGAVAGGVEMFFKMTILEAVIHSFLSEQHEVKTKIQLR
jgi:hypothetical protein